MGAQVHLNIQDDIKFPQIKKILVLKMANNLKKGKITSK